MELCVYYLKSYQNRLINSVNNPTFATQGQFTEQVSSKRYQYMKQICVLFGAEYSRYSDRWKRKQSKAKARIGTQVDGGQVPNVVDTLCLHI